MKTILIVLVAVFTGVLSTPSWNDLRTTFGINPLSKWDFAEQPRDLSKDMKGFTMMDGGDMCSGTNVFVGKRYWSDNDPALILLFDGQGFIAGVQTAVPKSSGWVPPQHFIGRYVIDETNYYTLTVYFVDPNRVCKGRSPTDFANEGTGTDLYIQVGTNPLTDYFQVPNSEVDIKNTKWGFGKCFYMMGQHYWYNVTSDMNCDDFVPYCLLYNKGVLNAFCFSVSFDVKGSERYEHPTPTAAKGFLNPVPDCFFSTPSYSVLTTMHVYTTSNYLADTC